MYRYSILVCCVIVVLSNQSGVDIDRTGSPNANETTCNGCHNGGEYTGNIALLGVPNSINNGDTLNLSLAVTNTDARGAGFQIVAIEQSTLEYVGKWIAGLGSKASGEIGLTHQGPRGFVNNKGDWKFTWIAPEEGGPFTFYYAVNFTNSNGETSGDNAVAGVSDVMLPVTYSNIDVYSQGNAIKVKWVTESEDYNDYFEIQKMSKSGNFTSIGTVKSKEGNYKTGYEFTDFNPTVGTSYYRLKQVDFDGEYSYSNVYSVDYTGYIVKLDCWYNSVAKSIQLDFSNEGFDHINIQIYSQSGNLVRATQNSEPVTVSDLISGLYYVKMATPTNSVTKSVFIY
jgi:hypothetical protein